MRHWITLGRLEQLSLSAVASGWLTETGSLTARLRRDHPGLAIEVVSEGCRPLLPDEARRLALAADCFAWVREVTLHENGLALLQARTVIPDWSPTNPWYELQHLGQRPLGEILFSKLALKLERSEFEFTLGPGWRAPATAPEPCRPARRCVFQRHGAPLLLTERFLHLAP